jgi:hypothetical protein
MRRSRKGRDSTRFACRARALRCGRFSDDHWGHGIAPLAEVVDPASRRLAKLRTI